MSAAPNSLLRWRLRHAARLLKKGVLNRSQYSAIAVKVGYGILGKPLGEDTILEQFPFSLALGNALGLPKSHSESEYRDLLDIYGPFNEAMTTFLTDGQAHLEALGKQQPLVWSQDLENAFKAARLQLGLFNRLALRIQDWWVEQERIFPLFTKVIVFIAGLGVGAVIGWFAHAR